ncbi:30S ribosomal protein S16 [Candidatus Peregrinibacteria bacterium]|nr:MAG: 30S ribosomal protein S16 [Candidatus Peregrinibacteria bacterium]
MLRIRLQRTGRKGRPFYRVVIAEHSDPIKGRTIAQIGTYNPLVKPWSFEVDREAVSQWISKGAQPTDTVARMLKAAGVAGMEKFIVEMVDRKKKNAPEEEVKPAPAPAAPKPAAPEVVAEAPAPEAAPETPAAEAEPEKADEASL